MVQIYLPDHSRSTEIVKPQSIIISDETNNEVSIAVILTFAMSKRIELLFVSQYRIG
jgi:hypothetical protein